MEKKGAKIGEGETITASEVSLTGLYVMSIQAMAIGVAIVFVLNLATPTDFIFERFADLKAAAGSSYGPVVGQTARRIVPDHSSDCVSVPFHHAGASPPHPSLSDIDEDGCSCGKHETGAGPVGVLSTSPSFLWGSMWAYGCFFLP